VEQQSAEQKKVKWAGQ